MRSRTSTRSHQGTESSNGRYEARSVVAGHPRCRAAAAAACLLLLLLLLGLSAAAANNRYAVLASAVCESHLLCVRARARMELPRVS